MSNWAVSGLMMSLYRGAHDLDLAVAVRKIGAPLFGEAKTV